MLSSKQELLLKIKEAMEGQTNARLRIAVAKKAAVDAESDLVEHSITRSNLEEDLRVLVASTVSYELTHIEKDVERFKLEVPRIMDLIDEIDEAKRKLK